jgi:hypothetical protein
MQRVQISHSVGPSYAAPAENSIDPYQSSKRPWRNRAVKQINFEHLCYYSTLNVVFEALLADGWATVDWINNCTSDDIDSGLDSLKILLPHVCLRAINRTTGRMMDFA